MLKAIVLILLGFFSGIGMSVITECIYRKSGLGKTTPEMDTDTLSDLVGDTISDLQRATIMADFIGNTAAKSMVSTQLMMLVLLFGAAMIASVLPSVYCLSAYAVGVMVCTLFVFPRIREYQTVIACIERAVQETRDDVQDIRKVSREIYKSFRRGFSPSVNYKDFEAMMIMIFEQYQKAIKEAKERQKSITEFVEILRTRQKTITT